MVNIIISFVIAIIAAVTPWTAFSADIDLARADQLIKKYNAVYERPKSCPLESKKFSDLIAKTEAIKDVLKGNCLKSEDSKMSEVLDSIKSLQDSLKENAVITNSPTLSEVVSDTDQKSNAISGLKFSAVFSNINNMIKKNQCNMEDGRVLETAADLIYNSTQLGVLSGNAVGLIVAGGGFLISSALRLIDMIIKQRFDFEKPADRQTFVKLNCSFYEIRRELDTQGALDMENSLTRDDYRDTKALADELTLELKKLETDKVNISKANAEIDRTTFADNVGDLTELKKTLTKIQKYLQPGLNQALDIPTETQKLLMISQLAQDYDLLVGQIKIYKELNISSIPMLDDLFIQEMKKFDSLDIAGFTEAMNISGKDFNENHRAKILFHIIRIGNDITAKEQKVLGKGEKQKAILASGMEKKKDEYLSRLVELRKIETRLGNLVAPKEYSGLDDGSDNMVAIIDNHNKITSQLYGEWGDKFLKYTTTKSFEEVTTFNERLFSFNTKYASILKDGKLDKIKTSYFCQDAQKLRLMFKHADSVVQEGYDFIATNKDLIYSDVKNYYNGTLNEEEDLTSGGSVEKVQRHYKSVLFALKKIKGDEVAKEDSKRYLEKTLFGNYFIGRSMVEVTRSKGRAKNIQDVYEQFACQKSLSADIEF
ncbi:hypothetical protein SHI21_02810 [Bacteriovorax sp. PP10]|uniref:Uncharacterized protein n=1 Tax=Bacteriovorax antarcticus TaxID=3088717 RepID=A0ABU5VTY4_9BACT|nr:hypothetical protein [Bacteriovorax sp. PP10]MEA9355110.1 hypothetical protein [Bacteriovorax sp. PP10]